MSSVSDVLRLLDFGHKMRAVGCTNANAASSRSHGVATFQLEQLVGREEPKRRWAQLQTVDLAGAARMDQIGDSQVRRRGFGRLWGGETGWKWIKQPVCSWRPRASRCERSPSLTNFLFRSNVLFSTCPDTGGL